MDNKDKSGAATQASTPADIVERMREMLGVQGQSGTWNYDPYFQGMYNGMEYMLAMVDNRDPAFREAPAKWLKDVAAPTSQAEPVVAGQQVAQKSTDWRIYHSALSQCAELLDNMKDGDPIVDTPKYLAEKLGLKYA